MERRGQSGGSGDFGVTKGTRQKRRLLRQFAVLERRVPALRRPTRTLLREGWMVVRVPLALLLILGGLVSFLPFLGLWMLPLGLLLLAVDVPLAQPAVTAAVIRSRRRFSTLVRRLRAPRRTEPRDAPHQDRALVAEAGNEAVEESSRGEHDAAAEDRASLGGCEASGDVPDLQSPEAGDPSTASRCETNSSRPSTSKPAPTTSSSLISEGLPRSSRWP